MADVEDLRKFLAKYEQEHLIRFWDTLTNDEKNELTRNLEKIDFETALVGYKESVQRCARNKLTPADVKPVPKSCYGNVNEATADELKCYEKLAMQTIAESKLAVLVLAGGQGSRLGITYPKGMYDVGLLSHKSLFQIQAERILRLEELSCRSASKKGCITWLIMVSQSTSIQTTKFFKDRHYFGLSERNVIFFEQSMLPVLSLEGDKVLMEARHRALMAPNGNGGVFEALRNHKVLEELERRGIEYVHAFSVDNILVKIGDPFFLGYCIDRNSDCGVKVVEKVDQEEKIGILCLVHDKWKVLEYSEIPPEIAAERTKDGRLLLDAGNICNHMFTLGFLRDVSVFCEEEVKLHRAPKKILTVIDERGERVPKPHSSNAVKLEKYLFDAFPLARALVVWKVNRSEEFSALKNSDAKGKGRDCPSSVRKDLHNLHRQWILKNGGKFETDDTECEISPLLSYAGEDLQELVRGKTFSSPCYLEPNRS